MPAIVNNSPRPAALALAFTICFLSIFFSGISSMLMSVYLPVAVKDLLGAADEETMHRVGAYINSIFIFGSMAGGFTWGVVCDRLGRSRSVTLSIACCGLFTLLTAFSSSWLAVGVFRFFTGFGVGGVLVTTNILVAELWTGKKKAIMLGLVSAAMPVGFIIAGVLNNLWANWHTAFLMGSAPLAVAAIAVFALTESGQWKANRSATTTAVSTNIFAPLYRKNLLSGSVIFGAMLIGLWAIFSWAPTWVQSIAAPIEAQDQRGLIMMVLAFAGLAGSAISGWVANALGLARTMLLCFAGCFIMTFIVFKLNTAVSASTFVEAGVLAIFFGISQGALSVYIPQLFPTAIRASATGFCFNIGRLFTATVVFFIGALVTFLGGYGNAVFIFSFIFLVGLAATLLAGNNATSETGETPVEQLPGEMM